MRRPRTVRDHDDVARFFDGIAGEYAEAHGNEAALLAHRLDVVDEMWRDLLPATERVLEIGCGPGTHLRHLVPPFDVGVGVDISPRMVDVARRDIAGAGRFEFEVDRAEELATVGDATVDAVLCVGAFEHMLDHDAAARQVRRVLRPGGLFVCLTHNGDGLWYRRIAPALGESSRHLSTDRSLRRAELDAIVSAAGLVPVRWRWWTFVARGDMPSGWGPLMSGLDRVGRWTGITALRGGLALAAVKPGP